VACLGLVGVVQYREVMRNLGYDCNRMRCLSRGCHSVVDVTCLRLVGGVQGLREE